MFVAVRVVCVSDVREGFLFCLGPICTCFVSCGGPMCVSCVFSLAIVVL